MALYFGLIREINQENKSYYQEYQVFLIVVFELQLNFVNNQILLNALFLMIEVDYLYFLTVLQCDISLYKNVVPLIPETSC